MSTKQLLNETIVELEQSEQMSVNGGANWSLAYYNLYGAFAKHGCAYPVGLLETSKYKYQSGVCTK